jgi:hypothetical protein
MCLVCYLCGSVAGGDNRWNRHAVSTQSMLLLIIQHSIFNIQNLIC